MQLATLALIDAPVTVMLVAPGAAVIAAGFRVSDDPPAQVVRLLGLSSTTSPAGSESTHPIPDFAASAVFEIVNVRVETCPTSTVEGKNNLVKF